MFFTDLLVVAKDSIDAVDHTIDAHSAQDVEVDKEL